MPQLRLVGSPPALGDHVSVADHDHAVETVGDGGITRLIERCDEGEKIVRRHPLGLRGATGKLRGAGDDAGEREQEQKKATNHDGATPVGR